MNRTATPTIRLLLWAVMLLAATMTHDAAARTSVVSRPDRSHRPVWRQKLRFALELRALCLFVLGVICLSARIDSVLASSKRLTSANRAGGLEIMANCADWVGLARIDSITGSACFVTPVDPIRGSGSPFAFCLTQHFEPSYYSNGDTMCVFAYRCPTYPCSLYQVYSGTFDNRVHDGMIINKNPRFIGPWSATRDSLVQAMERSAIESISDAADLVVRGPIVSAQLHGGYEPTYLRWGTVRLVAGTILRGPDPGPQLGDTLSIVIPRAPMWGNGALPYVQLADDAICFLRAKPDGTWEFVPQFRAIWYVDGAVGRVRRVTTDCPAVAVIAESPVSAIQ